MAFCRHPCHRGFRRFPYFWAGFFMGFLLVSCGFCVGPKALSGFRLFPEGPSESLPLRLSAGFRASAGDEQVQVAAVAKWTTQPGLNGL